MNVVCLGGACIDRKYRARQALQPQTSNPALASRHFGGVARNVAENLARLGRNTTLMTVLGDDGDGRALFDHALACGIDCSLVSCRPGYTTPEYAAVLDQSGSLAMGLADMRALETLSAAQVAGRWETIERAQWLFADCNASVEVLTYCLQRAQSSNVRLAIDAVSEPKVRRLPDDLHGLELFVLNEGEAAAYLNDAGRTPRHYVAALLDRGARNVILTRGGRGLVTGGLGHVDSIAAEAADLVDVTGAGDALCAGTLHSLMQGRSLSDAARWGCALAALTIESHESVRSDLSQALLDERYERRERACIRP